MQKEDLDTKSHSKGNKQFENGEAQSSQRLNFEPDFKFLNNKFMNSLKKDSNENWQKNKFITSLFMNASHKVVRKSKVFYLIYWIMF